MNEASNHHTNTEQEIRNGVMQIIARKSVHVRSRAYFFLRLLSGILLALAVLTLSVFVISFIFFSVHESGEQFLLGFGREGFIVFLSLFPWRTLVLDILAIFLLEWILSGFTFAYRISLLNLFVTIFMVSTVLGILLNLTPLHYGLLSSADHRTLPFMGEVYEDIRDSHTDKGVFRGKIIAMQSGQIIITHEDTDHDADDGTWTVELPPASPAVSVGDRVYVFGTINHGMIQAQGIEKLSPDQ